MEYYSNTGFENLALMDAMRLKEKQDIKRMANIIGVAYIILWLLPSFLSRAISDLSKLFNIEKAVAELYGDPAFIMVLQTVFSVLMFTLPFLIIPVSSGKRLTELISFSKPKTDIFLPMLLIGIGASAFANIATNSISAFFSGLGIEFLSPDMQYPKGLFGFVLSFIAVAIVPALAEEFAMRGVVMGSAKKYGEGYAVLVSSVIFALMHGNFVQIPFAFIMGLVIGFAVIKTESLWTGIAIHFATNAVSVTLSYLNEVISSVVIQTAITVVYFALCFLCFFGGILFMQKKCTKAWELKASETLLSLGDKIKYFVFSPCIIISIGLTVIDCIGYIHIT